MVSGHSKLSGRSGGQTDAIESPSAAMQAKKARRAPASGSSGSSTRANSITSKRPT
jgi:hypothetical protein